MYAEVMKTMMFYASQTALMNFFWNFGAFGSSLFVVLQLFFCLPIDNRAGRFKKKACSQEKSFSFGHLLFCPSPPPTFNRVAATRRHPRRDAANTLAWYASPRHDV